MNGSVISGCTEIDLTSTVKSLLPDDFLNGKTKSYEVSLRDAVVTLNTCPKWATAYHVAWNCSASMLLVSFAEFFLLMSKERDANLSSGSGFQHVTTLNHHLIN